MEQRPREEHLAWCKQRALEYLKTGDVRNALTSMMSDLGKHTETTQKMMGNMLLMGGMTGTVEDARKIIEGFN